MSPLNPLAAPGYDVIGDIHGHADALRRLLAGMGYAERDGVFRHDNRKVIFVGDFIDRGPAQPDVLWIARAMCAAGHALAVLGNHEFNAIGWVTPDDRGGFLRAHTEANLRQHREFLQQFGEGSPEHHEAISWFRSLPVWLDLPGLRVVHACWHEASRWMNGEPRLTSQAAACLDFSVAREGYLTAYRWSGERVLAPDHLVHVPAG